VTAIVGRSGAGKSALAGVLSGLWEPLEGRVTLGGAELSRLSPRARTAALALVFQDVALSEDTVRANLLAGHPGATEAELRRATSTAGCDEFVARLPEGDATVLRGGGAMLSAGERQRIAIARALLSEAPILIFDECTASLDAAAERAVHRAIAVLAGRKTVIVITHNLAAVRDAATIVVLADGRIVEAGRHDELVARGGEYAALWTASQRPIRWHRAG
jgi:ATP-binding cassette subfamily B protein